MLADLPGFTWRDCSSKFFLAAWMRGPHELHQPQCRASGMLPGTFLPGEECGDRSSFGDRVGASGAIDNFRCRVEAEAREQGGRQARRGDRVGGGIGPNLIAVPVAPASLDTTSRQDGAVTIRPVVAPGVGVDL